MLVTELDTKEIVPSKKFVPRFRSIAVTKVRSSTCWTAFRKISCTTYWGCCVRCTHQSSSAESSWRGLPPFFRRPAEYAVSVAQEKRTHRRGSVSRGHFKTFAERSEITQSPGRPRLSGRKLCREYSIMVRFPRALRRRGTRGGRSGTDGERRRSAL